MGIANTTDNNVYQKIIIYYFSGTGNSRNVASWMAEICEQNQVEIQIIDISKIDRFNIEPPDRDALIVFISPVHGFNYPPVMLHFIKRFPKGSNKVVLMNTRAGMLLGKFITPGLTGIAFYLAAIILLLKGFSIKAIFPIDLPSNWISLHPGLNDRTVKYLHKRNKDKVVLFTQKILSGKSHFKALFEIYDILLAPIALGYYFIGRFFFSKTFYASSDCNNCNSCIKSCPVNAIINVGNMPFWTFSCESCMKCMSNCPKRAIETGHGFILINVLIANIIIVALLGYYHENVRIDSSLIEMLIESSILVSVLALCYRINHYLKRFSFYERILVYTSLTKYKFWGRRYKALKSDE